MGIDGNRTEEYSICLGSVTGQNIVGGTVGGVTNLVSLGHLNQRERHPGRAPNSTGRR
jgi:hypothetical protein